MSYCQFPFNTVQFGTDTYTVCCFLKPEGYMRKNANLTKSLDALVMNEKFVEIRNSIVDGTYKYCHPRCPWLQTYDRKPLDTVPEVEINTVILSSDMTCNLKCHSCRNDYIKIKDKDHVFKKELELVMEMASTIEHIQLSGSGEFLMSPLFVDFITNLDTNKFKKLKEITIPTNGTLFTETMLSKIRNSIPSHIQISLRVSVDACTEPTYNVVRVGGNFTNLTKNLRNMEYQRSVNAVNSLAYNFIIQSANVNELIDFIYENSHRPVDIINLSEISQWGHISVNTFKNMTSFRYKEIYQKFISLLPDRINNTNIRYEGDLYDTKGVYSYLLLDTDSKYIKDLLVILLNLDDSILSNIEMIKLHRPHSGLPISMNASEETDNYLKVKFKNIDDEAYHISVIDNFLMTNDYSVNFLCDKTITEPKVISTHELINNRKKEILNRRKSHFR
jgi:hypothetical protein